MIVTEEYMSPCGGLLLGSYGDSLCLCDWTCRRDADRVLQRLQRYLNTGITCGSTPVTAEARQQLDEYFAGRRRVFSVPLLTAGTTFQKNVWQALQNIGYGSTASYRDIALTVGKPSAVRAAASAIGTNALSIFIPCHRIVGTDGTLTGYAGGLPAKRHLLALEHPAAELAPVSAKFLKSGNLI